jgi:hypothetical protein
MAGVERCSRDDKAPTRAAPSRPAKYEPDCGQNDRPGRWWYYVNNEEQSDGTDENGNFYAWNIPNVRRAFSRFPNPGGNLGVYKNHKGCTRYNNKKDACDRLHPKSGPRPINSVNKENKSELRSLINKYQECIDSIDLMNECVRRGIDPVSDAGHDHEKKEREKELKKLKQWYNNLIKKQQQKRQVVKKKQDADRAEELEESLRIPINDLYEKNPANNKLRIKVPLNENAAAKAHLERLTLVPGLALDGEFTELTARDDDKLQGMGDVLRAAIKKLLIRYILNGNQEGTDWKRKIEEAKEIQRNAEGQAALPEPMEGLSIDEIISAAPSGRFGIEGREFSETMMAAADMGVKPRWFYHGGQDKRKKTIKKKRNKKTKKSKKKKQKMKKRTKKNKQKH